MKRSWRKKCKTAVKRLYRRVCYFLFGIHAENIRKGSPTSALGTDEFGRDVESGLLKYVNLLKKRGILVHTVLVLGSRAKGHWKPESDVDVTVIATNLPCERNLLRLRRWFVLSDRPIYMGIEPSGCCTKEEFLLKLKNFDLQALDAMYYGKIIYDDGFWSEAKRIFEKIEEKYNLQETNLNKMLLLA